MTAVLIALNVILSGYLLGVYKLLNIGSFEIRQFKSAVGALCRLVDYTYDVNDQQEQKRFEQLFDKTKVQPELSSLSKYISPILPQPAFLKVIYESLVDAYLGLVLTPYSTYSNKIVDPLEYMQKLSYGATKAGW